MKNIPVLMVDDHTQTQIVRKVPKVEAEFHGKKYRINNVLWKDYLKTQEKFEFLLNRILNERILIPEASVRNAHGDYEDED